MSHRQTEKFSGQHKVTKLEPADDQERLQNRIVDPGCCKGQRFIQAEQRGQAKDSQGLETVDWHDPDENTEEDGRCGVLGIKTFLEQGGRELP
jgi:hypothetical protein